MTGILMSAFSGSPGVALPSSLYALYTPTGGQDVYVGLALYASGFIYQSESSTLNGFWVTIPVGDPVWLKSGAAGDYDALVTITGQSANGGGPSGDQFQGSGTALAGTWYNLGSDRKWYYGTTGLGYFGMSGTLQIAKSTDHATILATCNIDIFGQSEI